MKSVFVDANIVLEILFTRRKVEAAIEALKDQFAEYWVSPLTVHLTYYYGIRDNSEVDDIAEVLKRFKVLPMDSSTVALAQKRYDGKDFEDCLQAATAELARCDEIITLDRNFAADSKTKLPVAVVC